MVVDQEEDEDLVDRRTNMDEFCSSIRESCTFDDDFINSGSKQSLSPEQPDQITFEQMETILTGLGIS